ncbi:hypothetical protein J3S90_01140 [Flavobacterium sp. P4023]|uniref:Uncharacterized protein n=1 Tax=Flavobacterium flabelliforme TaxID=2816119 RepID=A0ABS5CP57_9FLAO|nr:hypothetical protein [Flavobacterium flabelliforme]MBP4140405.1 hypothetical protein [Flavobacterium flabelliforme]
MKKLSFIISFVYVLLGTIIVLFSFPKYAIFKFDYDNLLWIILEIITIPINVLLWGLVMVDNSILSTCMLQLPVFFITWFLFYKFLSWIKRKKNRNAQSN